MSVYLIEGDSSLECFKQSFTTMAVTTGFNQISNMGKRLLSLMSLKGGIIKDEESMCRGVSSVA